MPIPLPNLDDRTYDDLVQEALSLIPTYAPEWTNHNPSDPGITLVELFAYLTEMLLYRLNRVTSANKQAFLNLLTENRYPLTNEKGQPQLLEDEKLNKELSQAILELRQANRAITCQDFERLALAVNQQLQSNQQKVGRARCFPRRNLENENTLRLGIEQPDHTSVVIVPKQLQPNSELQPTPELLATVKEYLNAKRLLTTKVHVVGPHYLTIKVQLELVIKPGAKENNVKEQVIAALQKFFQPLAPEGEGWEFGRSIYVSEIYELLDKQPGVDYVIPIEQKDEVVIFSNDAEQRKVKVNNQLSAVKLQGYELVNFQINDIDIQIQDGRITILPDALAIRN
jgi:Baseplate J-like protein